MSNDADFRTFLGLDGSSSQRVNLWDETTSGRVSLSDSCVVVVVAAEFGVVDVAVSGAGAGAGVVVVVVVVIVGAVVGGDSGDCGGRVDGAGVVVV